jgi:hypothetical protein
VFLLGTDHGLSRQKLGPAQTEINRADLFHHGGHAPHGVALDSGREAASND